MLFSLGRLPGCLGPWFLRLLPCPPPPLSLVSCHPPLPPPPSCQPPLPPLKTITPPLQTRNEAEILDGVKLTLVPAPAGRH